MNQLRDLCDWSRDVNRPLGIFPSALSQMCDRLNRMAHLLFSDGFSTDAFLEAPLVPLFFSIQITIIDVVTRIFVTEVDYCRVLGLVGTRSPMLIQKRSYYLFSSPT